MTINYNVTGPDRKRLVQTIAKILECDAKYMGMPSAAYQIGDYTVDKNGTLSFSDYTDSEEVEQVLDALGEQGFEATSEAEKTGLEIQLPRSLFTDSALSNLRKLLDAKGALICKALGIDELPITEEDDKVCFPWFSGELTADEVKAYSHFIAALGEMARNAKRVTAKEKDADNEKYAFRCFLLRLGFIGDAYKDERKILLRNLTGSSAFWSGAKKKYAPGLDPVPTPENTVMVDVEEVMKRLQDPQAQEEIRAIFNGGDGEQA